MSFKSHTREYEGYQIQVFETITGHHYEISKDGKILAKSVVSYIHEKQAEITATWRIDRLIQEAMLKRAESLIGDLCQKNGYSVGFAKESIQQALNSPDFVKWIGESLNVCTTDELNLLYQYACVHNDLPLNYNPHR